MSKTIPLTQGKFAIVDDDDYEELAMFKWYAYKAPYTFYAERKLRKEGRRLLYPLKMHRLIMRLGEGFHVVVDHINGNGLDNRKENLRICQRSENNCNARRYKNSTTGLKCVTKVGVKFRAVLRKNGTRFHLGYFDTAGKAHEAYKEAAIKHHGEFARIS